MTLIPGLIIPLYIYYVHNKIQLLFAYAKVLANNTLYFTPRLFTLYFSTSGNTKANHQNTKDNHPKPGCTLSSHNA